MMAPSRTCLCLLFAAQVGSAAPGIAQSAGMQVFDVSAIAETAPSQEQGDAADDAEVWRNPLHPEQSRIFGTDKKAGLMVLDLSGKMLEFFPVGRLNNVDLRDGWTISGAEKVLIAASDRTNLGVSLFLLDPKTLAVSHLPQSLIPADLTEPYGLCLYRSRRDQSHYAIVTGKDGEVRQFALSSKEDGGVAAKLVRSFSVGSIAEGCVADDRTGRLYIAEEQRGIWRYGAEPDSKDARDLIAGVDGTTFVPDLEGLTLAPSGADGGYIVASVQGISTFALFSLPEEKHVGLFRVAASPQKDIDAVTGTDGVAVALGNFGPDLSEGILVMQDDENPGATQNFKIVSWADVLRGLSAGE